ncbi:MAG TPA: adenylate/guanylate cyclase domain-containing protein [Pyrinomonadaceae bacterium]|nr:adenylate/guanylate cyclase domain-containing protein [Pyrinomonadaceae bacterium]
MTWRRRKRTKAPSVADADLALETLGTERLRIIVLLALGGALSFLSLIPPTYFSSSMESAFRGNMSMFIAWRFVVLSGLVLYLVGEHLILRRLIARKRRIPTIYRYATALIETSFPTAAVIVAAIFSDPQASISSIPVFAYPLFIVLSALRLNFRLSLFTGLVAAVEYICVSQLFQLDSASYAPVHFSKGITFCMLGLLTGLVALQIKKRILDSVRTAEERNQIVSMFGKHVSQVVVDQLLAQGADVRSEKKNVCVMFLDIRNFTSFSEKRTPEEVVSYLETLFEFMIEIVNRNHGFINKFLGDGFMAVFGAPVSNGKDSLNAVKAAQGILERLNAEIANGNVPPTTVGIGLHAGEAVTGSIGSALRKEYTVIGDVVNLAARIEKLNKEFNSQLLISENVRATAISETLGKIIPRGLVQVRGREASINVYQLA